MVYCYDNALVDDLKRSFNPNNVPNPIVKIISPDQIVGVAAQIVDDSIDFPIVAVSRDGDYSIDPARSNFTWLHSGVVSVIDKKTNNLYYEQILPIKLGYKLTLLTTNTADMDDLVREILFKYRLQHFLTLTLPYESERKIRFGVTINNDVPIERVTSSSDYWERGTLYQTIVTLSCEGCVLVNYTPQKLVRLVTEIESVNPRKTGDIPI